MKLQFLLRIKGHYGIPDGEWEVEGIIENDQDETIHAGALDLIKKQYKKTWGDRSRQEYFDDVTITHSYNHITMKPGMRHGDEDYYEYELVPVLNIDQRFFELKEVTP